MVIDYHGLNTLLSAYSTPRLIVVKYRVKEDVIIVIIVIIIAFFVIRTIQGLTCLY